MLEVGTKAPEFTLQDQHGNNVTLSSFQGKKVVLYFYPKDNTSGCTKQACSFAERHPQFMERGAGQIATDYGLSQSFADILTGIILFCIIGSEFFITYQINFRHGAAKED